MLAFLAQESAMRFCGLAAITLIAACQPAPPAHPYPAAAEAEFKTVICRKGADKCDCAWDEITRSMPHEEYLTAIKTMKERGIMDRRIVAASLACS